MDRDEGRRLRRIEYLKNYHKQPENKYHKLYNASDITKTEKSIL
jgi:hypothetical protein